MQNGQCKLRIGHFATVRAKQALDFLTAGGIMSAWTGIGLSHALWGRS
jgi:hypothetical protein